METGLNWDEKSFDTTLANLERRREDENFNLDEIKTELDYLQVFEGHGWGGRSEIQDMDIDAKVTAYQVFIYREEKKGAVTTRETLRQVI